jgi:hypothetical protein
MLCRFRRLWDPTSDEVCTAFVYNFYNFVLKHNDWPDDGVQNAETCRQRNIIK